MLAIATLFSQGIFEHYFVHSSKSFSLIEVSNVLDGSVQDTNGLIWKHNSMVWAGRCGLVFLWIAAALTLITGWNYFLKAIPFLREKN